MKGLRTVPHANVFSMYLSFEYTKYWNKTLYWYGNDCLKHRVYEYTDGAYQLVISGQFLLDILIYQCGYLLLLRVQLKMVKNNTHGVRRGTRYMFSKPFKKAGTEPLSTFLKVYKIGDIVDIKVSSDNFNLNT